jgi:secreted Zn-dependent insulinase-like peptidase
MLQRQGPQQWVCDENKNTAEMNFRFLNKCEPSEYVTTLANGMHIHAVEHTVAGSHLHFQSDMEDTWKYLAHLTPGNSIITVSHKGFTGKTALKEKWYGTNYNQREYSAEQLLLWEKALGAADSEWSALLSLPQPNPFIPTEFALKPREEAAAAAAPVGGESSNKYPHLTQRAVTAPAPSPWMVEVDRPMEAATPAETAAADPDANGAAGASAVTATEDEAEGVANEEEGEEDEEEGEEEEEEDGVSAAEGSSAVLPVVAGEQVYSWCLQDRTWDVPKLNVKVSLENLMACATPLGVVCTDLLALCLKENLNEYSYYADCAGAFALFNLLFVFLFFTTSHFFIFSFKLCFVTTVKLMFFLLIVFLLLCFRSRL